MLLTVLTLSEIARRLQESEHEVQRWVDLGEFPSPSVYLPNGSPRWSEVDYAGWLAGLPRSPSRAPTKMQNAPPMMPRVTTEDAEDEPTDRQIEELMAAVLAVMKPGEVISRPKIASRLSPKYAYTRDSQELRKAIRKLIADGKVSRAGGPGRNSGFALVN